MYATHEQTWTIRKALNHARKTLAGESYLSGARIYPLEDGSQLEITNKGTGEGFNVLLGVFEGRLVVKGMPGRKYKI